MDRRLRPSITDFSSRRSHKRSPLLVQLDNFIRRTLDITLSLIGMIILAPLFIAVGIAIKRSSPGPIFYWGPRAGKDGKIFKILKFRTMYERKESYQGPKVTAENDPRITPLGHFLRQTKINELPQLWNVLIGDMSLAGPRPEDPTIVQEWPEEVRREILSVRPGITSPASVVYRNEEDLLHSANLMETYLWDILPTKLRLDQLYVRNRSFLTDLDVILWTLVALIPKLKTFVVPEHLLYWGPFSQFTYRYLGWFFIDFMVAFISVAFAGILRRLTDPFDLGIQVAILIALAMAFLFSLINSLAGLNRINWSRARPQDAFDLAFSSGIVTALIMVANLVFPQGTRFPMSVVLVSGILSFFGFVAVRYRSRLLVGIANRLIRLRGNSISTLGERVLIVGAGEVARFATWLLHNETFAQAFTIVGLVDDDPRKIGMMMDGFTVIRNTNAIPDLVKKYDIGLILFAIADIQPEEQDRILSLCQSTSARVIPVPDILESLRAQFPKNEAEREDQFNKVLHSVTTDRLTGAYNRQHFITLAEVEMTRAQRYHRPLSLVMIATDYVRPEKAPMSKTLSSHVLKAVARRCLRSIRGIDIMGRYADNILVILLPETNQSGVNLVLQRLKRQINATLVNTDRGDVQTLVSFSSVTSTFDENEDLESLLDLAYAGLGFTPSPTPNEAVSQTKTP